MREPWVNSLFKIYVYCLGDELKKHIQEGGRICDPYEYDRKKLQSKEGKFLLARFTRNSIFTIISYLPILMNIFQEFQVKPTLMVILKRQMKAGRQMLGVYSEKTPPITSYSKQWSQQTRLPWNQVSNPIINETFLILHIIIIRILVGSLEICASRVNTFSNWSGLQTKNLKNIVKKMPYINMDFRGEFDNLIVNQVSFSHSQFMF